MLQAFKSLLMKSDLLTLADCLFHSCIFGNLCLAGPWSPLPWVSCHKKKTWNPTATGFPPFPEEPFPLLASSQHSELRRIQQIVSIAGEEEIATFGLLGSRELQYASSRLRDFSSLALTPSEPQEFLTFPPSWCDFLYLNVSDSVMAECTVMWIRAFIITSVTNSLSPWD